LDDAATPGIQAIGNLVALAFVEVKEVNLSAGGLRQFAGCECLQVPLFQVRVDSCRSVRSFPLQFRLAGSELVQRNLLFVRGDFDEWFGDLRLVIANSLIRD